MQYRFLWWSSTFFNSLTLVYVRVSLAVFVHGPGYRREILSFDLEFMEVSNNKTDNYVRGTTNDNDKTWRNSLLQKILLTNRSRKTKPRDAMCAAVHKSTALARSLSLSLSLSPATGLHLHNRVRQPAASS